MTELRKLAAWAKESTDGSLADLSFRPINSVWDEIASDSGNCMGRSCPTYDSCFYYQARRRASRAQILVVNHALFFSDLALRRAGASILPDYDVAVLDEAHTIESVAGDHLGLGISSGAIDYTLNKLYNDRTNKGLLVHYRLGEAQQQVGRCRVRASDFFHDLDEWLDDQADPNGRVKRTEIVPNLLSPALVQLSQLVRRHGDKLKDDKERFDFTSAADRLRAVAGEIDTWLKQDLPETVYWVEHSNSRRGYKRFVLCASPIDVGPALREHLFDDVPSVILTSATLGVGKPGVESSGGNNFDYFKSRIGLTQAESLCFGSSFD
jgi:ATP-dependent DNA helicase DinG